jgi:ribosomal protein S16
VDPANKEDVAKAIGLGASLTDEATSLVERSKKAASSKE